MIFQHALLETKIKTGKTEAQIASAVGVFPELFCRLKKGKVVNPRKKNKKKITEYFNKSWEELFPVPVNDGEQLCPHCGKSIPNKLMPRMWQFNLARN